MSEFTKKDRDYTLYLVTDRKLLCAPGLKTAVEEALAGGCTMVQLREKDAGSLEFYEIACEIKKAADFFHVPLIINDRADIALAVDAAGVHVGQSDLPAAAVRRLIGADKILGVSASNRKEAVRAFQDGADYLGIGAMYETGTKKDARPVSMEELRAIRGAVPIPLVAIGGLNEATIPALKNTGINGIAVVSAILAQPDIRKAARNIRSLIKENFNH